MGLFSKKTPEKLEKELELVQIEEQVVTHQAQIAERKAVIEQLKREYGGGWKRILGIGGGADTSTLRSFLRGAKKGMERAGAAPMDNRLAKLASTFPKIGNRQGG